MPKSLPLIAVLIPCYNEAASISNVINGFRSFLPMADIYVYDNNSTDNTEEIARQAGAIVRNERRQGKGHVVRRMFADIDADIYVLVDGDGTYDAPSVTSMIKLLQQDHLEMVVAVRQSTNAKSTYRRGHQFGNRFFSHLVSFLFGNQFSDILSGYRVMSRRFVKSFPLLAKGFEVETQLTVHALELSIPCDETVTPYHARVPGSMSKLRTYRDGAGIFLTILLLLKETRPFAFFGLLALISGCASIGLGIPLFLEYFETGLVPRFPTAILASGIGAISVNLLAIGLMLDTVSRSHRELKRLTYLNVRNRT